MSLARHIVRPSAIKPALKRVKLLRILDLLACRTEHPQFSATMRVQQRLTPIGMGTRPHDVRVPFIAHLPYGIPPQRLRHDTKESTPPRSAVRRPARFDAGNDREIVTGPNPGGRPEPTRGRRTFDPRRQPPPGPIRREARRRADLAPLKATQGARGLATGNLSFAAHAPISSPCGGAAR